MQEPWLLGRDLVGCWGLRGDGRLPGDLRRMGLWGLRNHVPEGQWES